MKLLKTKTARQRAKRVRDLRWARANASRVCERNRAWRIRNPEAVRELRVRYYEQHRADILFDRKLTALLARVVRAQENKTNEKSHDRKT